MANDENRLALLQFGLRDAVALMVAFALMFFAVRPHYPSAPTITVQQAMNEISRGNVVEGKYFHNYEFAFLTLGESISDGKGQAVKTVSVDDPDRLLTSAFDSATIPYVLQGPRPLFTLLAIGTGVILIVAVLYKGLARTRRNNAVHRRTD